MAVACANFYSDISRFYICQRGDQLIRGDQASEVFDTGLLLAGIFHTIEWIRATVVLASILVGADLLFVHMWTQLPCFIFGLVTMIFVHISLFSEDGKACQPYQDTRAAWLKVEVIFFWTLFWIYQFPQLITLCYSKNHLKKTLAKAEESDEDSD